MQFVKQRNPEMPISQAEVIAGSGRVLGDVKRRRNERGCP